MSLPRYHDADEDQDGRDLVKIRNTIHTSHIVDKLGHADFMLQSCQLLEQLSSEST